MRGELHCVGKVELGPLPADISKCLAEFTGQWLEYSPSENVILVRHAQPTGCVATAGVPCELVNLLSQIPLKQRNAMPGGTLYLNDREGQVMRLCVAQGEVQIQWPHPDYEKPISISLEEAFSRVNPAEAKVSGWARFCGGQGKLTALEKFVDRFEGLYEEGNLKANCQNDSVSVKFEAVNVGPKELLEKLRELEDPSGSLEAELEVESFVPDSVSSMFRMEITGGKTDVFKPSFWK